MSKQEIVIKSNKLIEAIQTLSLVEARLLQLAIIDARNTGHGLELDQPLEINAKRYAKAFHVTDDAAYIALMDAEDSLFKRQFTITNSDGSITKSRWIQDANYQRGEGKIFVTLTRVVRKEVTRIDGLEQYFTQYRLEQTSKLSSVYAIRLYELLIQWKSVGKTHVFKLDYFRNQLGLGVNEYIKMGNFKARVLDLAVDQINRHSDMKVKYEQEKIGRKIVGFKFVFKIKEKYKSINSELNTIEIDGFVKLSDRQIKTYSSILSKVHSISDLAENKDYLSFSIWISNILREPKSVREEIAKRVFKALKTETDFKG